MERTRLELAADEAIHGSRNSYSIHFQVPLDDGTHQWTHIQARVLRSDDGRAHRIIGVVRDATAEITHSAFVLDLENAASARPASLNAQQAQWRAR